MLDPVISCCPQARIIPQHDGTIVITGCEVTVVVNDPKNIDIKKREFCDKVARKRTGKPKVVK